MVTGLVSVIGVAGLAACMPGGHTAASASIATAANIIDTTGAQLAGSTT